MKLKRMYGLDMNLPDGKIPGFYAQIVKGIAERAPLYDRYKELLIFDSEDHIPAVLKLLEHYRVTSERCDLLIVPSDGLEQGALYEDYAIVTRNENIFLDLALTAAFSLNAAKPDAEPAPALEQLKEHLIGQWSNDSAAIYIMDRQLMELAERIAIAYGCSVEWLY
ncbi:hypothetical protein [Cohnella silvisoli]|uniref:Uncharacterized protein n=1 Tax=Cohnella silvisoli TaxID=2873699 RepID=A0ABV1KYK6_9BACL|nr:hypothetical protein [Cohnella silvisoli]MCD9024455.1 hypothetical protein [Cohnella silvisoli]